MSTSGAPPLGFPATVPKLLEWAATEHGGADFVVTEVERLSFHEASERSALLARQLVAAGVGKGTRVGISLPSGIPFTVAFLAVARVGALAILISSTYRGRELARVLQIADVDTLIAPERVAGRDYVHDLETAVDGLESQRRGSLHLVAMPYLRRIWIVGGARRAWATDVADDLPGVDPSLLAAIEVQVSPADWLLTICTSGSTADPKMIVHTHGLAVRKVHPSTGIGQSPSRPGQRVLVAMPFFWVGGPLCLLGALHSGSTIVCQETFDPDEAVELIAREHVTSIAGWRARVDELRATALASGRALTLEPQPTFLHSSRGDPVNIGMTETLGPHHNPDFFEYRIVDPDTGASVAEGDSGEFWVRGAGVMAAMLRKEREETFEPDGWYRTGDRGYLEDGRVFFLGRYSEMLKSGGANVAPAEVEQALLACPGVAEAYVVGVPHPELGDEVVAVVVAADDHDIVEGDLRSRLKSELSSFKVPKRILVVGASDVPRLATGKVDKRAITASAALGASVRTGEAHDG